MPGEAAAAAPVVETPPADGQPKEQQGSDILEVVLEGMDKPTKIPLDRVKPELAKFRADADRKLSEADRRAKDLDARDGKYKAIVEKAKGDPDSFSDLAKELGLTEEELDQMSEARVARALKKAMQAADEEADPSKRATREQQEEATRLRQENEQLRADKEQRVDAERMQRAESAVVSVLDALGPSARNPEAAAQVVWTLRDLTAEHEAKTGKPVQHISELGDAVSPANLAKATLDSWGRSAARFYEIHPEAELSEAVLKRAEKIIDKQRAEKAKHPAEGQGGSVKNGAKKDLKSGETSQADKVLIKYLRL